MPERLDINRLPPHYWLYVNELNLGHNLPRGPGYKPRPTCTIRLCFDGGSHVGVSAVRLLIVADEKSGYNDILREEVYSRAPSTTRSPKAASLSDEKVMTIALVAVYDPLQTKAGEQAFRFLQPLDTAAFTSSAVHSKPPAYTTLHDVSYSCSPETHAFFISFEYERIAPPHTPVNGGLLRDLLSKTWHYELRVLRSLVAVHSNGAGTDLELKAKTKIPHALPILPSQTLKRIVSLAVSDRSRDLSSHTRVVLSLSLLSKQWLPALDLIWEHPHWNVIDLSTDQYLALSRSIQQFSHLAKKVVVWPRIRMVSLMQVDVHIPSTRFQPSARPAGDWNFKKIEEVVKATESALRCATELKVIATHSLMVAHRGVREALVRLEHVEEFRAFGLEGTRDRFGRSEATDARPLSMNELVDAIGGWRKLKVLCLSMCTESPSEPPHEVVSSFSTWIERVRATYPNVFFRTRQRDCRANTGDNAVLFQLETLALNESRLDRRRLLQLASHPMSGLRHVQLRYLDGLTHSDIRIFLLSCAPTLESIKIEQCSLARSGDDAEHGQGLAFDVALEHMLMLRDATIPGNLLSNLSLMNPLPSQTTTRRYGLFPRITILDYPVRYVMKNTDPCGVGIMNAIGTTEWATIMIIVGQDLEQQEGSRKELEDARARARATEAKLCNFDFTAPRTRLGGVPYAMV